MKPKIILCLALVLSGVLVGCSATAPRSNAPVVSAQKPLYTRIYQVDTNTFWPNFEKQTNLKKMMNEAEAQSYGSSQGESGLRLGSFNSMEVVQRALQKLLAKAGVDLQPPSAIFINDRIGQVLVRATLQQHDAVVRVLEDLNRGPVGKL